jgi:hypothetical protein
MTLQEQRQVAELGKELWTLVLPDVDAPELSTFVLWATFDSDILTRAINRTASKFRRMQRMQVPMNPDDCARYCSSVCRNLAVERKQLA